MSIPDPKNRINDLSGREWLQFQKSWFLLEKNPLPEFVKFFTKYQYGDGHRGAIAIHPENATMRELVLAQNREVHQLAAQASQNYVDYVYLDFTTINSLSQLRQQQAEIEKLIDRIERQLRDQCYITIVVNNKHGENGSELVAWEMAKIFGAFFQQKDEKIGCRKTTVDAQEEKQNGWAPHNSVTYFLHFRKEKQLDRKAKIELSQPNSKVKKTPASVVGNFRKAWYVHRPPRRGKGVLLHPAKFPEDLIERYIKNFTQPGEVVLDPMAGTGSALVAALACGRSACGIELNPDFVEIAESRFSKNDPFQLITGDAAKAESYQNLPPADYCITSPPYWDMLRMRGSETQKKRKDAGLQRWYSEDPHDAGNIDDYHDFIKLLQQIYHLVALNLKPHAYFTVIVKNVKKQGVIYPLAWDIVAALKDDFLYCGEQFWCQDDQRLSPFGYRYAWVSNTFHHYCLTFRRDV